MTDTGYSKQPVSNQLNNNGQNNLPRINKLKIIGNGQNNWSVTSSGPFYSFEQDLGLKKTENSEPPLTGATNLINHFGLLSTYHKFCGKPLKTTLSSFLPNILCNDDTPISENHNSLVSLIKNRPLDKPITQLPNNILQEAFRLHWDLMPEEVKYFTPQTTLTSIENINDTDKKHEKSHRKRQRKTVIMLPTQIDTHPTETSATNDMNTVTSPSQIIPNQMATPSLVNNINNLSHNPSTSSNIVSASPQVLPYSIKPKKSKKHDDEERRRRKKEKKEKKKKKDRSIE